MSQAPPSSPDLDATESACIESIQAAISFIRDIDVALQELDALLYATQPFESGRIGIRFVKTRGVTRPQARVYTKWPKRGWLSEYVSHTRLVLRVKKARQFSQNYKVVRGLCERVAELIQARVEMSDRLTKAQQALEFSLRVKRPRLANIREEIRLLSSAILSSEADAGFEVVGSEQ